MEYPHVKLYGSPHERATIEKGAIIGEGTGIGERSYIGMNARIGKNCRIMQHVTVCKDAVIEDGVFIGPNTTLLNDDYPPTMVSQPPIISRGAVIGGGVTIGPGVIIGENAVVGHGANISKDVPPEVVVVTKSDMRILMNRREYNRRQRFLVEKLT